VDLASVVPGRWRNGGGATRELAAWPAPGDWTWRISVADVAADGPFSRFEGVTRWFAVLEGAGIELEVDGRTHVLSPSSPPLRFDGGATTRCHLLRGPTRDFNLMVKSGGGAVMRRYSGAQDITLATAATVAAYAVEAASLNHAGAVRSLKPGTLAWRTLPAGESLRLSGADCLWMEMP
jgi:uncharacterized protein